VFFLNNIFAASRNIFYKT